MATQKMTWHEALDAQMGLWRFTRSEAGQNWLRSHFRVTAEGLSENTVELLRAMYASEPRRVLSGDPIFVSSDMCKLVDIAAGSFEPEPLFVTDLLTPAGFVFFETPFVVEDRWKRPVNIAAFSWAPVINRRGEDDEPQSEQDHTVESFPAQGSREEFLGWLRAREERRPEGIASDGICLSLYQAPPEEASFHSQTPLCLLHTTHWWFGMEFEGNEVDENGVPTGAGWWWRIVQSTLRLMQQRIAVTHKEQAPRWQRKEAKRLGLDASEVLVVRLRRERGDTKEPSGEEASYSHRFIVHAFWRNQWYPSLQAHRQILIADYVKGPKDKPLIVRPRRAFTWDR